MKIYFLSSRPCALTVNGAYFGITDRFEKFAEVSPKDNLFAEFLPEGALPVRFFINEALRFSPPEGCEVYLVKDGIAVYAKHFPPSDFSFRPILQERFENALATVFRQGELHFTLERDGKLFTSTLPPTFTPKRLLSERGVFLVEGENQIAVFDENAKPLLLETVLSFSLENGELRATLPLSDRLNRRAECVFAIDNGTLERSSYVLKQGEREDADILSELLPYAFFESVLIGANFEDFLSDELRVKSNSLRSFLGDFVAVTLTPDPNEVGLVYKKAERLFEVRYFRVETENGKITDVKK